MKMLLYRHITYRHCKQYRPERARKLCARCYQRPEVLLLYPPEKTRYTRRGRGLDKGGYDLPATPTAAHNATPEKEVVLSERVLAGVTLFHPNDAQRDLS